MNNKKEIEPKPLSEETLIALEELGAVLREIHIRLLSEGYVIKDGKIYKSEEKK